MFTKYLTSRRLSAYVLTLLLLCVTLSKGAEGQTTPPLVTGSFATSLTAPTGLGTVEQTVLDSNGDWLVLDYSNGALYEYPVGGGAMITLAAPGTLGGAASFQSDGITLDSMNNIYVAGNFNNCLLLLPYDATTNTWPAFSTLNATSNTGPDQCGTAPFSFAEFGLITATAIETDSFFQPWGLATLPNNVLVISSQVGPNWIMTLPVIFAPTPAADCSAGGNCSPTATPGTADATATTIVLQSMTDRPQSVAADKFGNIYFVEDSSKTGRLPGAYMIPAGDTLVPTDTSSSIVRVDPMLPSVQAVATDVYGNVYISDSTEGVFLVPNPSGTPETANAVLVTPVPATGQVSVDSTRGILFFPTTNAGLTEVTFNAADLGSTATGAPATTSQSVTFSFGGAVTPGSFVIQEAGAATPDFAIASGGTCTTGTAYAAQSSCTENVTLSPTAAGNVSAKLLMLDGSGNLLDSITLQGTGTGSSLQVTPSAESVIGAGLKTPSQVAVDADDNTYVADSGLGAVEVYPKGYGAVAAVTTVGTGLTAPTGVAVDGAGDVFIADTGVVYEVPIGPTGLNAAGQVTLVANLGTSLKLAADGFDNLYIADMTNHQVVKLSGVGGTFGLETQTTTNLTNFTAPSAVAVDQSGNLFVVDGQNLDEVTPTGTQTMVLNTLSNTTGGLAVDPSEAVYVTMTGGTVRIPNISGTLTPASETTIAATVTSPTSVAIDSMENVYITDAVAENVNFVQANGSVNFGTLTSATAMQTANISVQNVGNAAFNFTAFGSTPDFSETTTSCTAPVAVDGICTATITFNPGPGDGGTLTGQLAVLSGAANSAVVEVVGVGVTLATSTTAISVMNATVDGAPAVITVAPGTGTSPAPTGQVTLTVTGTNITTPVSVTGTLANGTVTITPPQLSAGTYTFTASYQGDRTYGPSNASAQVVIGVGAVTLTQGTLAPSMSLAEVGGVFYLLATGSGSQEPFDGSVAQYEYTYPVTVAATDGVALIGQPVFNPHGTLVASNYGTVTYQGAPLPGCQPVAVASTGVASFTADCVVTNTSNNSIPDLETTYTVTPMYSPAGTGSSVGSTNPNYAPVTGTPITFTALRNPVVVITASPSSLSITPGSTATATLTLSSILGYGIAGAGSGLNNYSLPVQLECDGLPANATCSFSYPTPDPTDPQSVDVGPPSGSVVSYEGGASAACTAAVPGAIGGCFGPGTVIMTINTSVSTGVASLHRGQGDVAFAAMFGLGLLGFAFGKKKSLRGSIPTLVCLLICSGIMAGISGCSTKQLGTTTGNPTPTGTYMVSVTAAQVGSQVITAQPGIIYGNENQVSLPFTMSVTIQ
jgi:hypothetical protein